MVETVSRKRIEILVDTPLVARIVRYAREADISGWSVLHVDSGGGRDGEWTQSELTGAAAKTIVLIVTNAEKAQRLVDRLAPLLDSYGLLLTIGDVNVVRGDRF
ncbi:MAG TPA: DUF190 domain-containing protein [Chakrabartia sp.]|jgi:PII-like signaling protein|nr:DUF190 domain-containing protein [Chakrabartia sp.]